MKTVASRQSEDQLGRLSSKSVDYVRGIIFNKGHHCTELSNWRAISLTLAAPKVISMHSPGNTLFAYYSKPTVVIIIRSHQFLILNFQSRKLLYLLPPVCVTYL